MDRERIMGGVQDEAESVGSDVGGTIPPLQGIDFPAAADAGITCLKNSDALCMLGEVQNCQCSL